MQAKVKMINITIICLSFFEITTQQHIFKELYECGTGGIQGLLVRNGLVERNRSRLKGTQEQRHKEKLLCPCVTLPLCHAGACQTPAQRGDSRGHRNKVTKKNFFVPMLLCRFVSQVPKMVTGNWLMVTGNWYSLLNHQSPITNHQSDELTVAHNFVAHCTKEAVEMRICQGRMVGGRLSTCKKNRVLNNILIKAPKGVSFIDDDNLSDCNIFVDCGGQFDFNAWQKKGFGPNSITAKINASFNQQTLSFAWSTEAKLPLFPKIGICTHDFFDSAWQPDKVPAGLFSYPTAGTIVLELTELWEK